MSEIKWLTLTEESTEVSLQVHVVRGSTVGLLAVVAATEHSMNCHGQSRGRADV